MLSSGKKKYTTKQQKEPETQQCSVTTGEENDKTNICIKVCTHTHTNVQTDGAGGRLYSAPHILNRARYNYTQWPGTPTGDEKHNKREQKK